MSRPIVTVCIVTCNQRDLIEQCLRSVLEQESESDMCILVGDDASDDGTSEIVAAFAASQPAKIRHLRRQARLGGIANMRDLIARADGEFIARLDGDDYWLPGKLARQLAFLRAHPDCAAVYTNAITVDRSDNPIGMFNDVGDSRFDLAALLRRGNFLNNSSVLFPIAGRQAWNVDGPQIDYRAHLWHARHGWLGHIGEPLTAYRVSAQGSMVAGMNERVRELYWEAILSVPREMVSDHDRACGIADFIRRVFFRALGTRDPGLLRDWWRKAKASAPCSRLELSTLVTLNVLRAAAKEIVARLTGKQRVLYRR